MSESTENCFNCGAPIPEDAPGGNCFRCLFEVPEPPAKDLNPASAKQEGLGRIGRYRLLEKIGEGGFGIVFRAEQVEPIRREVALKVIKPGMDSRQVIARFEAERQALALMHHPGIAQVLDGGETAEERPYFVMELVVGENIVRYCDEESLPLADRLELFCNVCLAVDHAHQRGIIHRDLKPSNVLVDRSERDGPQCKIIDFGIAKATQHILTGQTVVTQNNQLMGTPEYMSPEQAESGGVDVDTRSDVYSLGILLYELLTGSTPVGRETLRTSSYQEILHEIREVDPPRPSDRLRETSNSPDSTRRPHSPPPTEPRMLRGDLDWIVLKAVAKERSRRYQSAGSLAADVQRFRNHEAVEARPPSATYLLAKFIRKNRLLVGAASAVAVATIAALVVSLIFGFQAREARDETRRTFSQSDFYMASELMRTERTSDAIAHLCRALRNNPDNVPARYLLWSLLTESSFPVPLYDPLKHERYCVANFSPDGRVIATCSGNRIVRVFDTLSGTLLGESRFESRVPYANQLVFSADGERFAVSTRFGSAQVFSTGSAQAVSPLLKHGQNSKEVWAMQLDPSGAVLYTSCLDGTVRAWNCASGAIRWQRSREFNPRACLLNREASRLYVGWDDGTLLTLDPANGHPIQEERPFFNPLVQAAITRDGKQLAMGSLRGSVRTLDLNTGQKKSNYSEPHTDKLYALTLAPSGMLAATSSYDKTFSVWHVRDYRVAFQGHHGDHVYDASFRPDGAVVASASRDKTIRFWNARSGEPLTPGIEHELSANGVRFHPGGVIALSTSRSGLARVWDTRPRHAINPVLAHPPVAVARLTPESDRLVTIDHRGNLEVREPSTEAVLFTDPKEAKTPGPVGITDDGRYAVSTEGPQLLVLRPD